MEDFLAHVKAGLSAKLKKLSSRYFYDEEGSKLYQKIMASKEYYLPELEMAIIHQSSSAIARLLAAETAELEVLELGAGDGSKTVHILKAFAQHFPSLTFTALDISPSILAENRQRILKEIPLVHHESKAGDYFKTLAELEPSQKKRLFMFLGANIGNFTLDQAAEFLQFVKSAMAPSDYLLVAFDMVKDPETILKAYNDEGGHTAAFNLNLLSRINRELGGNFDLAKFKHHPFYNPLTGLCSSQLISLEAQKVQLVDGSEFEFKAFEPIHTEISKKYFRQDLLDLAEKSGMDISQSYYAPDEAYALILFRAASD